MLWGVAKHRAAVVLSVLRIDRERSAMRDIESARHSFGTGGDLNRASRLVAAGGTAAFGALPFSPLDVYSGEL